MMAGGTDARGFRWSDVCERAGAAKALEFTRQFVADADQLHVHDLRMETSADEQGYAAIFTDRSSLGRALRKEGLARPDKIASDTPWCGRWEEP
ncbi:MAG: hypothetical protein PVJ83_05460 [Gammaproteobacteria bacterium]|jgi:hypothetical protein